MGAGWSQGDMSDYLSKVDLPGAANLLEVGKDGKVKVYELNGDGTCRPLPGSVQVPAKLTDVIQNRMYVTTPGDKRNLRLYADKECDIRANEETYMKKSTMNNQNILYFPATGKQNATYYKINESEPNKPPLPFFMVTPNEDAKTRFASERGYGTCLPIPYVNSGENYGATMTKAAAFQRDRSNLSLYTDPECNNIYTQTNEILDLEHESYYPYSTTTTPYTNIKGYGGRIMEKTNARYYKIKDEKWNVTQDIDPERMAAVTAVREERARLKAEREARERKEAQERLYAREQELRAKASTDRRTR